VEASCIAARASPSRRGSISVGDNDVPRAVKRFWREQADAEMPELP